MNKLFFLMLSCIVAQGSVNAMEKYPLHEAAKNGDKDLVEALLLSSNGADINLKDQYGRTAFEHAAAEGIRLSAVRIITDYKQRIQEVRQRVPQIALTLAMCTHPRRLAAESPLALLDQELLRYISQLTIEAEYHDASKPRKIRFVIYSRGYRSPQGKCMRVF